MCEYCDHDTNEDAKRFPLFGNNDRDEAFIDEDNYLSVYTKNGDWVGVAIKFCPMCGKPIQGATQFDDEPPTTFERTTYPSFTY